MIKNVNEFTEIGDENIIAKTNQQGKTGEPDQGRVSIGNFTHHNVKKWVRMITFFIFELPDTGCTFFSLWLEKYQHLLVLLWCWAQ